MSGADRPRPRISTDEIQQALLRSGYLIEYRIAQVARRARALTLSGPTFEDPVTGTPRELDLQISLHEGQASALLLIECMNNEQPVSFFIRRFHTLHSAGIRMIAFPARFEEPSPEKPRGLDLKDDLDIAAFHHYARWELATQYCSFVKPRSGGEWIATHADPHFDAFEKLERATQLAITRSGADLRKAATLEWSLTLFYPIVVLGGPLAEVRVKRVGPQIRLVNHVVFRRRGSSDGEPRLHYVDVVTERNFPKLLKMIQGELRKAELAMRDRSSTLTRRLMSEEQSTKNGGERPIYESRGHVPYPLDYIADL